MPRKNYNRKQNTRGAQDHRSGDRRFKDTPQRNDWQFYAASEEIARGLASVPFNYMGGTDFPMGDDPHALPCCIAIPYVNSVGVTTKGTEGVNMAAAQLYTYIRHTNSGAKNYEAADVMMYVLAMRDVYAQYFNLRKAIGLCSSYNFYNHNLPDLLLKAMGISATDLRESLANYRTRLNILAKKINSFAVPKYFKVFDRTAFINSYIFSDSSSIRGQFYNFVPAGYYTWSGKTSEHGTELVYKRSSLIANAASFEINLRTMGDYLNELEGQINALFLDTDALTMSGDILKAFPNAELYSIGQIPDDYQTSFIMDEDVLAQIENMRSLPFGSYYASKLTEKFNITQANQLITFNPSLEIDRSDSASDGRHLTYVDQIFVNSHKDSPDYKDVLEWTRLISTFDVKPKGADNKETVEVTSTGLEIALGYCIATEDYVSKLLTQWDVLIISPTKPEHNAHALAAELLSEVSLLSKFDWHPVKYIAYNRSTPGLPSHEPLAWYADVKVATTITPAIMSQINDGAVYGALYSQSMYNNTK